MRDRTPFHFALTFTKDWMLQLRQVTLYNGCGNCCRRPGMHYWNEYVFEGYLNHQDDMIILAGYQDIPLSKPQSKEGQALRGE